MRESESRVWPSAAWSVVSYSHRNRYTTPANHRKSSGEAVFRSKLGCRHTYKSWEGSLRLLGVLEGLRQTEAGSDSEQWYM